MFTIDPFAGGGQGRSVDGGSAAIHPAETSIASDDGEFEIDEALIPRVALLHQLQEIETTLDAEYKRERLLLEEKYIQLRVPVRSLRMQVVNGISNATAALKPGADASLEWPLNAEDAETISALHRDSVRGESQHLVNCRELQREWDDLCCAEYTGRKGSGLLDRLRAGSGGQTAETEGVPGFWLQVLANHDTIGKFVYENDCDALTALQDISCSYSPDLSEFTLTFRFGENASFSNRELVKVYRMAPDLLDEHCPVLLSIDSLYPIFWHSRERNLCDPTYNPQSSFFWYFCSIHNQSEMDPCTREAAELCRLSGKFTVENDYEIAHTLRTKLLSSAISCFTGGL